MRVHEKVREFLDSQKVDARRLAGQTGISEARMHDILSGAATMYADDLYVICMALRVPPETFLEKRTA